MTTSSTSLGAGATRMYSRSEVVERRQLERFCQALLRVPHVLVSLLQVAAVETFLAAPLIELFDAVKHERVLLAKCASMAVAQSGSSGETLLRESTLAVAVLSAYGRVSWESTLARVNKAVTALVAKTAGSIEVSADRVKASENAEANVANYAAFLPKAVELVCSTLLADGVPLRIAQVVSLLEDAVARNPQPSPRPSSSSPDGSFTTGDSSSSSSSPRERLVSGSSGEHTTSGGGGVEATNVVAGYLFLHIVVPSLSSAAANAKHAEDRKKLTLLCRVLQQLASAPSLQQLSVSGMRDVTLDRVHRDCWLRVQSFASSALEAPSDVGKAGRASSTGSAGTSSVLSRVSKALTRRPSKKSGAELSEEDRNHIPAKVHGSDSVFTLWSFCANHRTKLVDLLSELEPIERIDVQAADLAVLLDDILSVDSDPRPDFKARDLIASTMRKVLANNMSLLWQSEAPLSLERGVSASSLSSSDTLDDCSSPKERSRTPANDDYGADDEDDPSIGDRLPSNDRSASDTVSQCASWTPEELASNLVPFIGEEQAKLFAQHRIQGVDFCSLSRADLSYLGISQLGLFKAIERAQAQWHNRLPLS